MKQFVLALPFAIAAVLPAHVAAAEWAQVRMEVNLASAGTNGAARAKMLADTQAVIAEAKAEGAGEINVHSIASVTPASLAAKLAPQFMMTFDLHNMDQVIALAERIKALQSLKGWQVHLSTAPS